MKKKKKYEEGTLFSITLSNGLFGIGLIARINDGVLLCYFLKNKFNYIPSLRSINLLFKPVGSKYLIEKVGSAGLDKGEWVVLGNLDSWHRSFWPVPIFKRKILSTEKFYIVNYDDNLQNPQERVVDYSNHLDLIPNDGTSGYKLLEKKLCTI
jgi:hypothetical protein